MNVGIGVAWLITLGEGKGRQYRPWVLGKFIYEGIKLER